MFDFLAKEAHLCVNYAMDIQPGETVLIWGDTVAIPLIKELYRAVILAGAHPILKMDFSEQDYILHELGNQEQLAFLSPTDEALLNKIDVGIKIFSDTKDSDLSGLPDEKIEWGKIGKGRFFQKFFGRLAQHDLKWTLLPYPTTYLAEQAEMSLLDYAEMVRKTMFLDHDNPREEWVKFSKYQQKYCDFLNTKKTIRIVSNKTDISMSIDGRTWLNSDGHNNLPDGEIYTGPVEDSVNGTIYFDMPSTSGTITPIPKGLEGISLTFKEGVVVEATAEKGQLYLGRLLSTDEGAKRLGELAIGTNPGVTKVTGKVAFDEKIKGTIHLALGNGYPETGSHNRSQIHWDIICDMREYGEIYADGELFYKNGDFLF